MIDTVYDIYGFVFSVDEGAKHSFDKEYKRFSVDKTHIDKIDIFVTASKADLPIKVTGDTKGVYLPFGERENTVWYNPGLDSAFLTIQCEGLMWWNDKALLHAGAVSKNGKVVVFTGRGGVGKTSTVLNLITKRKYEYLSDDWLIIGNGKAYPFPKTIHIFDYNLRDKQIANAVLGRKKFYCRMLFRLLNLGEKLAPHRYVRFAFQALKPSFFIDIADLYPQAKVGSTCQISKIFYFERWHEEHVSLEGANAEELAMRMAYVNLYERNRFFQEYYKYASGHGIKNAQIENRFQHDFQIFFDTFKAVDLYKVLIPDKTELTTIDLSFLPLEN